MKLTDVKIIGHFGNHPSLFNKKLPEEGGRRSYFPHIHMGGDECSSPKYYEPSGCRHLRGTPEWVEWLQPVIRNTMTINEAGTQCASYDTTFDALCDLFASAPEMLRLLESMLLGGGEETHERAIALVERLLAHDIQPRDDAGWGPYYNKNGTPWKEGE